MKLIANTILASTAVIRVTDSSNADLPTETATAALISKGGRYLSQAQSGTAARRYVYINTSGGLAADTAVIVRADRHNGKNIKVIAWSDYPATSADIVTAAPWSPTFIGAQSKDAIIENLGITGKEAIGLELGSVYAKTISQVYFGTAFSLDYLQAPTIDPHREAIQADRQVFMCGESITIQADKLTRANVETFEALHNLTKEPCFLYDSTGVILPGYLWHCLIPSYNITPLVNDLYSVRFTAYRLREES